MKDLFLEEEKKQNHNNTLDWNDGCSEEKLLLNRVSNGLNMKTFVLHQRLNVKTDRLASLWKTFNSIQIYISLYSLLQFYNSKHK